MWLYSLLISLLIKVVWSTSPNILWPPQSTIGSYSTVGAGLICSPVKVTMGGCFKAIWCFLWWFDVDWNVSECLITTSVNRLITFSSVEWRRDRWWMSTRNRCMTCTSTDRLLVGVCSKVPMYLSKGNNQNDFRGPKSWIHWAKWQCMCIFGVTKSVP